MRIFHKYLKYNKSPSELNQIRHILEKYDLLFQFEKDLDSVIKTFKYTLEFRLYEDNPSFSQLKRELEGLIEEQVIGTDYELGDYETAKWFLVNTRSIGYPKPENSYATKIYKQHKLCSSCGMEKEQIAPLQVKFSGACPGASLSLRLKTD